MAAGDGRSASSLVRALAPYLYAQVPTPDGRTIARSTLGLTGADPIDRGHVLYFDACVSMDMGLADETRAALAEAESLFVAAGDLGGLSLVSNLRCFHEATVGNYEDSRAAGERACAYARRAGSKGLEEVAEAHLAISLLGLGTAGPVRDEDALRRALDLVHQQVRRADALGSPYARVTAYTNIAAPLLELGRLDEASTYVRHAIELGRGHGFALPYAAMTAARVASQLGRHEVAVRILGPCLDDLSAKSVELQAYSVTEVDAIYASARAELGAERFAAAERAARRTSLDEAIELALRLEAPVEALSTRGAMA